MASRPFIFTSDFHLGKGDQADDFSTNAALTYRNLRLENQDSLFLHLGDLFDTDCDLSDTLRAHTNLLSYMHISPESKVIPGNHDGDIRWLKAFGMTVYPTEKIAAVGGHRTLLTHGHLFCKYNKPGTSIGKLVTRLVTFLENNVHKDIDVTLGRLKNYLDGSIRKFDVAVAARAKQLGCTQAIYGHTHYPKLSVVDGIIVANTGTWTHDFKGAGYPVIVATEDGLSLRWVKPDGTMSFLRGNNS